MARDGARPDVSIVTSGHDVADARLHREVAAFVRAGLTVEVLGLGDPSAGPASASVSTHPRGGAGRRALDALVRPWQARGRVIVVLDPDPVPSVLAQRLLRRRPVVVDVHEDYTALLRDRSWASGPVGGVARGVAQVVSRAAARGDLTVVADDHVPPGTARNRLVVRNLPDVSFLPEPGPRDPEPRAVYVGDVRASRGLFTMLDAVAVAPAWSLDVVGPVAAADQAELDRRLSDRSLGERVRLHGRKPPAQAWEVARGAWAGLLLLAPTPAFVDAVPSKLYEYLACGLAVVATDLPRQAALVAESGAGEVVTAGSETGAAAGAVLRGWADDPAALDVLRESGLAWTAQRAGEPTPYDVLAQRVAALVRSTHPG